ncbi:MAG TPA: hypothetical protein VJR87_07870 [Allosphingosinicella sp.]|nr:hypothetical protein [Allosphingosinicella sp.]
MPILQPSPALIRACRTGFKAGLSPPRIAKREQSAAESLTSSPPPIDRTAIEPAQIWRI